MTMAQDLDDVLGVFGDPVDGTGPINYTFVRRTDSFSDSGAGTPTWTAVDTKKGSIQADVVKATTGVKEAGAQAYGDFLGYFPASTVVREQDRVRPPGWTAGSDEYLVEGVDNSFPSHVCLRLTKVLGHAS